MIARPSLLAALALAAAPAAAQTGAPGAPGPGAIAAPEPARLAAARRVLDRLMPPATRAATVSAMVAPMMANMREGMAQSPQLGAMLRENAKMKAVFDRFMDAQEQRSLTLIRDSMPGMVEAMARAYARRFDVTQLGEIERFFATPTGAAYAQASMSVMSDPDVAAFQRQMMADAMRQAQASTGDLAKEIAAVQAEARQ